MVNGHNAMQTAKLVECSSVDPDDKSITGHHRSPAFWQSHRDHLYVIVCGLTKQR